jgi:hypothetical protein
VSTLTYVGSLSLGQCVPLALAASAQLSASIGIVLPKLQAELAGLLALQANLTIHPPSIAANIDVVLQLLAGLQTSLTLGLPGIDFQIAAVLELVAKIQVDLGSLSASLSFGLNLQVILGALAIDLYVYEGAARQLGPALGQQLTNGLPSGTGPNHPCNAIVLATESPVTWGAMSKFFRTG